MTNHSRPMRCRHSTLVRQAEGYLYAPSEDELPQGLSEWCGSCHRLVTLYVDVDGHISTETDNICAPKGDPAENRQLPLVSNIPAQGSATKVVDQEIQMLMAA